MDSTWNELLKMILNDVTSRKFLVALVPSIGLLYLAYNGIKIDFSYILAVCVVASIYIVVQGVVDAKSAR